MIPRDIMAEVSVSQQEYPVIAITGPRQSGKTTLAKAAFAELPYVSFEDPLTRSYFNEDPKGFIHRYRDGGVFDEVQHVPPLFSYLQVLVDESIRPGRFVLTGSQHFGLTERITQSLAGRSAVLELLPFSADELRGADKLNDDLDKVLWSGAYPPVHDRGLRPGRWYANYTSTYIERDVRQVTRIQDLDTFTRFMRLCAGNIGQLVNTNRMGGECGVDHKTIRNWLTVLRASYVVTLLSPFHRNFRKRVIKTPKLYFFDTGLACHLLGIETAAQLSVHPLRGAIFENWVFAELAKSQMNRGRPLAISFWRTHAGQEVDFIIETAGTPLAIDVKSGMTVTPAMIRAFDRTLSAWKPVRPRAAIVFGGKEPSRLNDTDIVPWTGIGQLAHGTR